MDFFNWFLSVVMHAAIALLLAVYLPFSLAWRVLRSVLLRPFFKEDMRGKVVLITGASSGIGEYVAYEYAKRGASMALVARREEALRVVAKKAGDHGAPDVLVIVADISDPTESKRVVKETVAHFGQLNHLVVNAGIGCSSFFERLTGFNGFTQLMDVNFWGSAYPTYYAIPHLKKSNGRIVVNASIGGWCPSPRMSFYCASKAAVIMLYETLRLELGSAVGITIVTLGFVASELTKGKVIMEDGVQRPTTIETAKQMQLGPFPVGSTDKCAEVIVDGACSGDAYITWPSWYKPFPMIMNLAPELMYWLSSAGNHGRQVARYPQTNNKQP